jgi:peptidyl-prolyl cis-trans isomerase SurA
MIERAVTAAALNLSLRASRTGIFRLGALVLAFGLPMAAPAQQSPFSPAIIVNDSVVTYYELAQRVLFLELLRAPGDLQTTAREALVNERLQQAAGERLGFVPDVDAIQIGMTEFANRAELELPAFIQAIGQEGVDAQTFRDFVSAGLTWRSIVQTRFGARSQVSEDEIDRAVALTASGSGALILLSELVIPLTADNQETLREEMIDLTEQLDGNLQGFSEAAGRLSAASTAGSGGRLDWRPLSALPPALRGLLLTLNPGDVTDPVPLGPAFAIFQLRAFEETEFVTPVVTSVEYAQVLIPGGRSAAGLAEAQDLRNMLDSCDDLYGVRPGGFTVETALVDELPTEVAFELAKLDEDEVSTDLTRQNGEVLVMLMLCGRSTELPEGSRDDVRQSLFFQRLESYADGYLEELRADAIITVVE